MLCCMMHEGLLFDEAQTNVSCGSMSLSCKVIKETNLLQVVFVYSAQKPYQPATYDINAVKIRAGLLVVPLYLE